MHADNITAEPEDDMAGQRTRPRASAWLWRRWYAKLWWTLAALYWAGKLGSVWSPALDAIYSSAIAGFLNVLFFPPAIAMVLASGLVRAWMDYKGLEWGGPTRDELFPRLSIGGWRDRCSDPLDPSSGLLHWRHFHRDQ